MKKLIKKFSENIPELLKWISEFDEIEYLEYSFEGSNEIAYNNVFEANDEIDFKFDE